MKTESIFPNANSAKEGAGYTSVTIAEDLFFASAEAKDMQSDDAEQEQRVFTYEDLIALASGLFSGHSESEESSE